MTTLDEIIDYIDSILDAPIEPLDAGVLRTLARRAVQA